MNGYAIGFDQVVARPRAAAHEGQAGRVPYLLLLAFVFALYAHPALVVPALAPLRPTLLVAVAAIGSTLGHRLLRREPLALPWPQGWAFTALLGVALISSFEALWPRYGIQHTLDLVRTFAVFLAIVNIVDTRRRLWGLLMTFVVAGAVPALGALTGYRVTEVDPGGRIAWIGNFGNPNDLAFNLIVLAPLALAIGITGRARERLVAWPALALYLAAIFLTYSRGGLLALLGVLGLAALSERGVIPRLFAGLAIVGALVFVSGYWARDQGFADLASDPTVLQRITTIHIGLDMWADRPFLGVGPGNSVVGWPLYAPAGMELSGGWLHNHNTFVQVLSETGLLGFAAFTVLFGSTLLQSRRLRRDARARGDRKGERLAGALRLSLWGFLLCGLTGGLFLAWYPYLLAGAVAAWIAIERREAPCGGEA